MKAVLCKEYGPPESLVVEEIPSPEAGPGQVVVRVRSAGVNFPDVLIIENKYQFKPPLPFTPGGEVAGEILSIGEGVEDFAVGDRVLANCGWQGFAEEIALHAAGVFKIPDSMDFETASAFLLTYGTSHYALKQRAKLRAGEDLVVLGAAGGVGIAALEIGKVMGARVIAAASTPEKLAVCKEHGADEVIDYSKEDLKTRIRELTGGKGADVVYDPVGGDFSEPCLRAMAWEGRFLVIGFAAGEIPKPPLNLALLKSCDIVGVFWGAFVGRDPVTHNKNVSELLTWFDEGRIKPRISASYPLADVAKALRDLSERRVKGKVVIIP